MRRVIAAGVRQAEGFRLLIRSCLLPSADKIQECEQLEASSSSHLHPSLSRLSVRLPGHWRSRSSRYLYSKVKPSFLRWPHFS